MKKTCENSWCKQAFEVLPEDIELLRKFDVETSYFKKCPLCRHIERSLFRPILNFYHRKSDMSGKELLSIYPPQMHKVYSVEEWWSDRWEELSYGRDFDFSQNFFSQFESLFREVPKMAVNNTKSENCEYSTNTGNARNCYYSFRVYRSVDILYTETATSRNNDLCDCLKCFHSSWLYNCVSCHKCHQSTDLIECENSRDCFFCIDCAGCHDCLFCSNLRRKSYHVFNEPVSKQEFEKIKKEWIDASFRVRQKSLQEMKSVLRDAVYIALHQRNCEDCVGDQLTSSAHLYECYDCMRTTYSRFAWDLSPSEEAHNYLDVTGGGIGDLLFNCGGCGGTNYFLRMCAVCRLSSNLTYCINCFSSKNCFGCTGLRNKQYCIFNKQYSKEEYEEFVPRIIEHMRKTGEWGKFFPIEMSSFKYNTSCAFLYAPLPKEKALAYGFSWQEKDSSEFKKPTIVDIPNSITDVNDSICSETFACAETGKNYRIIPQELKFYKQMNLPLPRKCPDQRMLERRQLLNPKWLWKRKCDNCRTDISTTFSPDRKEKVYCEKCYLDFIT